MAKDELGMTLALMERDGTPIPEPSMNVVSEDLVTFILVNTLELQETILREASQEDNNDS